MRSCPILCRRAVCTLKTLRSRMPHYLLLTSLFFLATMSFQANAFEPYEDPAGKVVKLSTEMTDPFRFFSKVVRGSDLEKDYSVALSKFPSVQSCLLPAKNDLANPSLTAIDWEKVSSDKEAAVCLFRIASSYESPEAMSEWLRINGFEIGSYTPAKGTAGISASLSVEKHGIKYSANVFDKFWKRMTAYSLSVGIQYGPTGSIQHIAVNYNYL